MSYEETAITTTFYFPAEELEIVVMYKKNIGEFIKYGPRS